MFSQNQDILSSISELRIDYLRLKGVVTFGDTLSSMNSIGEDINDRVDFTYMLLTDYPTSAELRNLLNAYRTLRELWNSKIDNAV